MKKGVVSHTFMSPYLCGRKARYPKKGSLTTEARIKQILASSVQDGWSAAIPIAHKFDTMRR
jgi:hypothetical protein